jgi:hypothetical protein
LSLGRGLIFGSVIDHDYLIDTAWQVFDDQANGLGLISGWNDNGKIKCH